MVYENILEAVGNTPLIRLHHMTGEEDAQIFVKFEAVNVGASIKTRTALGMIKAAEREGKITKETIIVEPTSGNQGSWSGTDWGSAWIPYHYHHAGFRQ